MSAPRSISEEVIEIIREMPGLTSGQIIELMPHVKGQSVHSALNKFFVRGIAERKPGGVGKYGKLTSEWFLSDKPLPQVRKTKSMQPRRDVALVDGLKQRIAELEQWKTTAIARFPDLGIDPIVLNARQIVSAELRSTNDSGDRNAADAIMAGQRDNVLAMRLVIKMLEEKAA